ncbi:MAG: hypothetical protein ACE5DO_09610 [Desulfobacterales bacterium]
MAADRFEPNCLPVLTGSLPIDDHRKAARMVQKFTPEIPSWVQLPKYKNEGMIAQFVPGLPGIHIEKETLFVDIQTESFEQEILQFYEEYIGVSEGALDLCDTRFILKHDTARGFFELIDSMDRSSLRPVAVKGQITGPVTFGTGVKMKNGKSIFYDEQLRDASTKLLALKARWQVKKLLEYRCPVIIFFDEPGLAGFGSSGLISISREEILICLGEMIEAVHAEGGLAGIHVCANTDWSLILDSSVDIVNFDAFASFDRFILYPDQIKSFTTSGGILAWGIVPTLSAEDIEKETTDSIVAGFEKKVKELADIGIDRQTIFRRSLITPSCGAGSLSLDQAEKVLTLTRSVSDRLSDINP